MSIAMQFFVDALAKSDKARANEIFAYGMKRKRDFLGTLIDDAISGKGKT